MPRCWNIARCWWRRCRKLTAFGQPVRALLDTKKIKSAEKRWNWVRRGAPIIVEIGPRDAAGGKVTYMRRDDLRDGDKVKSIAKPRRGFSGRRGAAAGRDPGRALCRSQGAAGRQYQERRHRLEGRGGLFRRQRRRVQRLAASVLVKADRRGAGRGGSQAEGLEAHHPQCAAASSRRVSRPACSRASRAWKRF